MACLQVKGSKPALLQLQARMMVVGGCDDGGLKVHGGFGCSCWTGIHDCEGI
jgi:hypothetical protein